MEEKTILLKALTSGEIRIKPRKDEFLKELMEHYGLERNNAQNLLIECNREGLVEIDSMTKMVGITAKGRDFVFNSLRDNYVKAAFQVYSPTNSKKIHNRQVNWDRRNFIVAIVIGLLGILTMILIAKYQSH